MEKQRRCTIAGITIHVKETPLFSKKVGLHKILMLGCVFAMTMDNGHVINKFKDNLITRMLIKALIS